MTLPAKKDIEALHVKYATSNKVFELIYTHSQIIWEICQELIEKGQLDVDTEQVRVGALLHDIGTYRLYEPDGTERPGYITHGVIGYEILKDQGFDEAICRFASHHTGTGISKQQIIDNNLPLPAQDYFAETPEEELVMYADKFHSKTAEGLVFNDPEWYATRLAHFGQDSVERFQEMQDRFGLPDIKKLSKKRGHPIRDNGKYS